MNQENRYRVLGIRVDALTPAIAIDTVRKLIATKTKGYLLFCTVSSVLSARADDSVKRAFEGAALVTPDGMPLVWLGRRAGMNVDRVYGPDFMVELMRATGNELQHYFYGGAPGVAEEMTRRLKERFPELVVAGVHSPSYGLDPANPDPMDIARINEARPNIVWIGLGHPKQDLWALHNSNRIDAPVLAAVGAAFDFHSGHVREAPDWMKRSGLQWLHRLASDPKRLWKRYLIGNTQFMLLLLKEGIEKRVRRRHGRPNRTS